MSAETKQILMIASRQPTEALRMASGLTLLDDVVEVAVLGALERNDANSEQLEALDFADVPVTELEGGGAVDALAEQLMKADVVFNV